MNKKSSFEENYFSGEAGIYSKSYNYKAGNINIVYHERALPFLKPLVPQRAKVLDVACAFGDLLALLDKPGYETYGIDISRYALGKAKHNTKAKLILGDVNEKLPYKKNFFDAIFAFDIIEHVTSPAMFLLDMRRMLKKGGLLFLQTPNINSIFEKLYKDKWFGYQDNTHLHLFTRKSLGFLVKKAGFLIVTNETFAAPFPALLRTTLKNTEIGGNIWLVAKKI